MSFSYSAGDACTVSEVSKVIHACFSKFGGGTILVKTECGYFGREDEKPHLLNLLDNTRLK